MKNPFQTAPQKNLRPTFLTVLCVLTFVGSGYSIFVELTGLFADRIVDSDEILKYITLMGDLHAHEIYILNLGMSLAGLLGAILMFLLRRSGFYLYAAAQILSFFVIPYSDDFFWLSLMAVSAVFSLLFIILYGLNLKHLK